MKSSWTAVAQKWLGYRWLPAGLALAAVLVMLPALDAGLGMDDLLQRVFQLEPDQVPQALRNTGMVRDTGTLRVVLSDLFGFTGDKQAVAQALNYGVLPWWTGSGLKAALWRPMSAFTHWVDYRIFPGVPWLMHAHSIAWFAGVVLVAALLYRQFLGSGWVAGLAGLLFLLDKDTFFPVMFVANRGFIISLFFGLCSIYAHHRWRLTGSGLPAVLSGLALGTSLFSNEAGVSTLAFLAAYALFFEPEPVRETQMEGRTLERAWLKNAARRVVTVLPAVAIIVVWRLIYQSLGHGVANVGVYLDPSQEPLSFLTQLLPRSIALLGGQLTGLPPEFAMALHPSFARGALFVFCGLVVLLLMALVPLLLRDRVACFWFVAMLLALIPAATVVPLSKNLGFVAIAAFGLIACFVRSVVAPGTGSSGLALNKWLARAVCAGLLLTHIPGAIGGRIAAARIAPAALGVMSWFGDVGDSPGLGDKNILVLNAPCALALMETPFVRFYQGREVPKTLRSLVPGCIGLQIERTDACTLVVRPSGPNIFNFRNTGPLDLSYAFVRIDQFIRRQTFNRGYRVRLKGLEIEVLEVDEQGLPAKVAFRFDPPLDSPSLHWLYFDWASFRFRPLELPALGETRYITGPHEG